MMDIRAVFFAIALAIFVSSLAGTALYFYVRSRRSEGHDLEKLMEQFISVDREHIALIARDWQANGISVGVDGEDSRLEPSVALELIGGMKGLEALEANSEVLITLVSRLQKEYPEALVVAEHLRLHAREIQWYIGRLKAASRQGHGHLSFPEYVQQATVTYFSMTELVLALYEEQALPGFAELHRIL